MNDHTNQTGADQQHPHTPIDAATDHHENYDDRFAGLLEMMSRTPTESADSASSELVPETDGSPWVLSIDDDAEFTYGLQLRLQEQGVKLVRNFAGMEGYRNAFMGNPSAIILDYEMPDGNGDYVLRRLKETRATGDIPVIVLTGRNDRALERKMYNLGADKFLTKPCSWDKLWSALHEHLAHSHV